MADNALRPLILTLRFDAASFARFDADRRRHFPAARNVIPAHLTLFHHLPGDREGEVAGALAAAALRQEAFSVAVPRLRFLGQGTAYEIESPDLMALRARLAALWAAHLTPQDAQGFRPHVTIQNKTSAPAARTLFDALSLAFEPFEARATGLLLWRYCGGPWEEAGTYPFAA